MWIEAKTASVPAFTRFPRIKTRGLADRTGCRLCPSTFQKKNILYVTLFKTSVFLSCVVNCQFFGNSVYPDTCTVALQSLTQIFFVVLQLYVPYICFVTSIHFQKILLIPTVKSNPMNISLLFSIFLEVYHGKIIFIKMIYFL